MGKTTVGQIEAYVRQQASADHVPGTAAGIVEGSQPVLLSGFGDASASTSFFLGSLSNKAGLTELSFAPSTTFTQAINGFEAFPLTSPPGKKFQYSDANYTIAGYIVQQVSGQSYDSYVQQHIFAPLGMTHTYAMTGVVREPGLTRGYANWLGLKVPLTDQVSAPLVPAGYIISSASDMTHYLTAEMNGGVYNGTRVLPAQAMQETHAPLAPVDGQPPVPGALLHNGRVWCLRGPSD